MMTTIPCQTTAKAMRVADTVVPNRFLARLIAAHLIVLAVVSNPIFAKDLKLHVSNEVAPAGGWAQIKITASPPQAIASGGLAIELDGSVFGDISAVAVFSAQGEASGIATVTGRRLSVDLRSTGSAGGLGQLTYFPVLTITVPVLPDIQAGKLIPLTLDVSQQRWVDGEKQAYSVDVIPGSVTVAGSLSIKEVVPGGGLMPSGTVVRILGTGFTSSTAVVMDGVSISDVRFVSGSEIDLTLGGTTELTGKKVLLRDSERSQTEYFVAMPSVPDQTPALSVFAGVEPLLSTQTWRSAALGGFTVRGGGIVLQNVNTAPAEVIIQVELGWFTDQFTVMIPPGSTRIYQIQGVRALAISSVPIRILGLGILAGLSPPSIIAPAPVEPPSKRLIPDSQALTFQWQAGTSPPAPTMLRINGDVYSSNDKLPFRVTAPAAPFAVTPSQSTTPAVLTVSVNPGTIGPGTYSSSFDIIPDGPNAVATTIPLSLTVTSKRVLSVDPGKLTFFGRYLGPFEVSQPLNVTSNGDPIAFAVATMEDGTSKWLSATASAPMTPARVSVTAQGNMLTDGVYTGAVVIAASDSTVKIPVELRISPDLYSFFPSSITFSGPTGSGPSSQTVGVSGIAPPTLGTAAPNLAFSVVTTSGGPWLTATQGSSGSAQAVVTVNPTGLRPGIYTGKVTLISPAAPHMPELPVTLAVWDQEPRLTLTPSSVTFTEAAGTSAPDTVIRVESGGVPIAFTRIQDGPQFLTPASITVSPCLVALGSCQYDLTFMTANQSVDLPVTTIVTASPLAPPVIGSIVSAGSQKPGAVSPGEIITIYGFAAGPPETAGFSVSTSGKIVTSLNGSEILFDGRPAPIIFGSAFQANVIAPYEIANQPTTTIQLRYGTLVSESRTVPVAATAPAIFTVDASGSGQGAVLNQDNSLNGPSNPASRGSVIEIFATGEGQTSPSGETGGINTRAGIAPLAPVNVTIGGQDAFVQYAGSAPGSVSGLLQVNAVVPGATIPGAMIPINISIGGVRSQGGVTVAVQ